MNKESEFISKFRRVIEDNVEGNNEVEISDKYSFLLNSLYCMKHNKDFTILYDIKKNILICSICKSSDYLSQKENPYIERPKQCNIHFLIHKLFCLTCMEFICIDCICDQNQHRYHSFILLNKSKEYLKEEILSKQSKINEIINIISIFYMEIYNKKLEIDNISLKNQSSVEKVKRVFPEKIYVYIKNILNKYIKKDLYDDEFLYREILLKRLTNELNTISEYEDSQYIEYKIKNSNITKGINQTMTVSKIDSLYMKLDKIIEFIYKKEENIENESDLIYKTYSNLITKKFDLQERYDNKLREIKEIFKTVNHSLKNSFIPKVYFIRRFVSFFNPGVIYFERTSILIENNNDFPINLLGFGICGLINSIEKCNLKVKLTISEGELLEEERVFNNITDININKVLYNEEILLKEINFSYSTNPIQTIYLSNYSNSTYLLTLHPSKVYKVDIVNLDSESYIKIWNGRTMSHCFLSMFKEKKTSFLSQVVYCNSNDVKMKISSSDSTDLNEFSNGIISDILYSCIDIY